MSFVSVYGLFWPVMQAALSLRIGNQVATFIMGTAGW